MLRQDVERAFGERRRVLRADRRGLECCAAFQHLEAVRRHQDRLRRLVHAVVGAADALRQPAGALRRADMDDEVDVAPVDAEVERRRRDDGAQAVRLHRLLDAPPLGDIERAVMQRDRQVVLVDAPELGEQQLRLAPRIDEEQRGLVLLHQLVDFGDCVARRMPLPRHTLPGIQHRDIGLGPTRDRDQLGHGGRCPLTRSLRSRPLPKGRGCAGRNVGDLFSPTGRRWRGRSPSRIRGQMTILPHKPAA